MSILEDVHGPVYGRRIAVLGERLAGVIPPDAHVLDIGCGDGLLAANLMRTRPDITIEGIDVLLRPQTHIPVTAFDGEHIPFPKNSFDAVMFVDVLHHTHDPQILLREARRVARRSLIIKDHTRDGVAAGPTLRFMDWVGNARHGVALPYNYWPRRRWDDAFRRLGLTVASWDKDLCLYPPPAHWLFDRSLHFTTRLDITDGQYCVRESD